MPKYRHATAKLYRKVRVSGSVDVQAFNILKKIMENEKRSLSNTLNLIIYEAGQRRDIHPIPPEQKDGTPNT